MGQWWRRIWLGVAGSVLSIGCGHIVTDADYVALIKSGKSGVPTAVQMEELFRSNVRHALVNVRPEDYQKMSWQTETFFGGKYQLTMDVKVKVDFKARTVTQLEEPVFYFFEIEKVDVNSSGSPITTYNPDHEKHFGIAEWKKVYESGGDFSKIGIEIKPEVVKNMKVFIDQEESLNPKIDLREGEK